MSKTRLRRIERAWRDIVFGHTLRILVLGGLALFVGAALASSVLQLDHIARVASHYAFPLWFALYVWLVASSYVLTAILSFVQRDVVGGEWMSLCALLLALLGVGGLRLLTQA